MRRWPSGLFFVIALTNVSAAQADVSNLIAVRLNILWRVQTAGKSTVYTSDLMRLPMVTDVPVAYIAASSIDAGGVGLSGVVPLSRYLQSSDRASGFLWTKSSALPGTLPLLHEQLGQPGENANFGYAYPRHMEIEMLRAVDGGGVTIKSNVNAGGAVCEWWWMGKQFINNYDYGRQLSMALYVGGHALQEAGDGFGPPDVPPYARHPSPALYVRNNGRYQQASRAIPLEWLPQRFSGGKENPVIYVNAKIGKQITLDWTGPDRVDRKWPVVLYESQYEGPGFSEANVEAPTAYLNSEFNTYYKYDPATDTLTPLSAYHNKVDISAGTPAGLVIASGPGSKAVAMGVYIDDPNAGLVLYDNSGPDGGKYGSSFSKWGVVYFSAVAPVWKFRTWITTDTVENVKTYLHQLAVWKVKSRDFPPSGK